LPEEKYSLYFNETWWLLIPCALIIISISIFSFFSRNDFDLHCTNKLKILFVFYLISILIIFAVISFKFVTECLCFSLFLTISFLIVFVLNSMEILKNKNWIKLGILFFYFFVFMIVYLIVRNKFFVEFFILIILSALFFTYYMNEMKRNFIFYVKENKMNSKVEAVNNMGWSMYNLIFSSIMIIKIDIFFANFR
jgi:prepilin signal peptidase PulO-like enzyme (type II secretory pathway)